MEKERAMNTCIVCGEKYDVKNTKRVFGDMHWIYNHQCSPICHTKYTRILTFFVNDVNSALAFSDGDVSFFVNDVDSALASFISEGDVSDERILEIAKEKTYEILEILR